MPALKPCGRPWNVGSDDFGLASLFAIVVRIICVGLLVGVAIYLYVGPSDCEGFESTIPAVLYGPLLALVAMEVMVLCNEGVLLAISCRGRIWYDVDDEKTEDKDRQERATTSPIHHNRKPHPRRHFLFFLFLRVVLYFFEFALVVLNTITFFSSFATGVIECDAYHDGPLVFGKVISVILLVVLVFYAVGFLVYSDPLGCCCAPPLMKDMSEIEEIGEKELDELDEEHKNHLKRKKIGKVHTSHLGNGRIFHKFRGLLCCSSAGGRRSRAVAVQEMSAALSTLFSDQNWVPSDLVAGLILVSRNQRSKREQCGCYYEKQPCTCLIKSFKELTFHNMPEEHKSVSLHDQHVAQDGGTFDEDIYTYKEPQSYDFKKLEKQLLFEDLVHYMEYSMGIYGWPLHVFDNLCCGFCQLGSVTCCRCNYSWRHQRFGVDFIKDGCCMTGVGTIRLKSKLLEDEIRFCSYENEVYQAPFSVCVDKSLKSVVITIRGTLSIQDALTDLSVSMYNPIIKGFKREESYIHNGMYRTAKTILKQLHERKIIETLFNKECWDYQLVVNGHSLGAGVAAVLALLLTTNHRHRHYYRDLKCYAYSPPGCIFSYPLALYSRRFITTVVLGNDMIPRVTFPSLLYLKRKMLFLLKTSKKSKPQILFQPRILENNRYFKFCCGSQEDNDEGVEEISKQVLQKSTFKQDLKQTRKLSFRSVFAAKSAGIFWKKKATSDKGDTLHHFVKAIQSGEQIASFPPGKVIHVQVGQSAKVCCLGFCYPNQLKVYDVCSEDFGVIMIDKGMVDDHLPNEVLRALKQSKKQLMGNRDKRALAALRKATQNKLTEKREELRRQVIHTEPDSSNRLSVLDGPQLNAIAEEDPSGPIQVEVDIEFEVPTTAHDDHMIRNGMGDAHLVPPSLGDKVTMV